MIKIIVPLFLSVSALVSCGGGKKDVDPPPSNSISISPTSLAEGYGAATKSISVTAQGAWTVLTNGNNWLSVSPSSGTGNGTVSITIAENNTGAARSGNITLQITATIKAELSITQDALTFNGVSYGIITINGKQWLDRNLGAKKRFSTNHMSDKDAFGDLYQWGRTSDGHQVTVWTTGNGDTDATTSGAVSAPTDGPNGKFVLSKTEPRDWRATPDNTLWNNTNPCPEGWRIPTSAEMLELAKASGNAGALPFSGMRNAEDGKLYHATVSGHYWTSEVSGRGASYVYIDASNQYISGDVRANGYAIRCIKK